MSTEQFPIEYVESHGKPFAMPQAVVVHSRRANEIGRWYRQFGFEVFRQQADDGSEYITARCAGLLLKILATGMTHDAEKSTLYFLVDDFQAVLGAVAALDATVTTAPFLSFGRRRIVLTDPDGRRVVFTQREKGTTTEVGTRQTEDDLHEVTPSEAATPEQIEFERAFAAIRRGAKASLLALAVNIAIGLVTLALILLAIFDARAKNFQGLQNDLNKIPVGAAITIGTALACSAMLVSVWHRTKRVNYTGLWLVIILDAFDIAAYIVTLFGNPRGWEAALITIHHVALFTPVLYFQFLSEFFKAANMESVARHMNVTMYINFVFALSVVAMTLRTFLPHPDMPYLNLGFVVLMFVAVIASILAVIHVAIVRRDHDRKASTTAEQP